MPSSPLVSLIQQVMGAIQDTAAQIEMEYGMPPGMDPMGMPPEMMGLPPEAGMDPMGGLPPELMGPEMMGPPPGMGDPAMGGMPELPPPPPAPFDEALPSEGVLDSLPPVPVDVDAAFGEGGLPPLDFEEEL